MRVIILCIMIKRLTEMIHNYSKEEYFAMLDRAKQGSSRSFTSVEELDRYIRTYGHYEDK